MIAVLSLSLGIVLLVFPEPCQSQEPPAGRDSAGVFIVVSGTPRWGDDEKWRVGTDPELTIESRPGPKESRLRWLVGGTRLPGGMIAVAHGGGSEVLFYRPDGTLRSSTRDTQKAEGSLGSIRKIWHSGNSIFVHHVEAGHRGSAPTPFSPGCIPRQAGR